MQKLLAAPTDQLDEKADDADDNPASNFRKFYHLPKKPIVRCSVCGVEHRGRCFFLRRPSTKKPIATAEEVRAFVEAAKQRRHEAATRRVVKRLIKELCDGIDKGRKSARRANWWTPEAKKPGRPVGRRNLGVTKKDTES